MRKKLFIFASIIILAVAAMITLFLGGKRNRGSVISTEQNGEHTVRQADAQGGERSGTNMVEKEERLQININLEDYYSTNIGSGSQMYHIDENNILWGCGSNQYGQLGLGFRDYDFHQEMQKIAENVIHIDYSESGFTIYITKDHKLYGMGNAGGGALLEYSDVTVDRLINGEHYTVDSPKLLFENVIYAKCGQNDVVCLMEDGSVWTWGTVWRHNFQFYAVPKPEKILENVVFITGGWYNHAALMADGNVYTWGYNYAGNCGIADQTYVSEPVKVADNVVMVWTGKTQSNTEITNISEFNYFEDVRLENTIILKADGTYWACGATIGDEKTMQEYYEAYGISIVCTSEFIQIPDEKYFDQIRTLATSGLGDYQVQVIQKGNRRMAVSAESKSDAFEKKSILMETKEEIQPEDIEVIWMGEDEPTTAEIKVLKRGILILDYKVDFMRDGAGDWENMLR